MTFFSSFCSDLQKNRALVFKLAQRQFFSGTMGSALGVTWTVLEPLVYVGVLFFFFTKAARFTPSNTAPYLPWLMCAVGLWQFFSQCLTSLQATFKSHSYMMKKWKFNISILPVVTILSSLFIHLIFVAIMILVFLSYDILPSLYWLQLPYFVFCQCCLLLGLGWTVASLSLFFKDLKNLIAIGLQLGFWISPIFWDTKSFPYGFSQILALNPIVYLMQGYRDTFLFHVGFWEKPMEGLIYWSEIGFILAIGSFCYRKLRPSFGDVLS